MSRCKDPFDMFCSFRKTLIVMSYSTLINRKLCGDSLQTGDMGAGGWFVDFCSVAAAAALEAAAKADGEAATGERQKVCGPPLGPSGPSQQRLRPNAALDGA